MSRPTSRSSSRRRLLAGLGASATAVTTWGLAPVVTGGAVTEEPPTIVGHRGAEGLSPPNTTAGIRRALEVGVDGIELDVRRTSDGELILFHDPVLDWDSTGHGWVQSTPWEEIRGAEIDGEPVVTLAQGLDVIAEEGADVSIFLEVKDRGYTDAVLETVAEFGLTDRVRIVSFEVDALASAREAGVPTGLLGSVPAPWLAEDAAACGADLTISHYAPHGVPRFVEDARSEGLAAGVWKLVDTRGTVHDVLEHDLDVLVTNRPDYALEVLAER